MQVDYIQLWVQDSFQMTPIKYAWVLFVPVIFKSVWVDLSWILFRTMDPLFSLMGKKNFYPLIIVAEDGDSDETWSNVPKIRFWT